MNLLQSNILNLLNNYRERFLSDDQIYWATYGEDKAVLNYSEDEKYNLVYRKKTDFEVYRQIRIELDDLVDLGLLEKKRGDFRLSTQGKHFLEKGGLTAELKGVEYATLLNALNELQSSKCSLADLTRLLSEETLKSIIAVGLKKCLGLGV